MSQITQSDFDPRFRVMIHSQTERPNLLAYLDLHTCYAESSVIDDYEKYASWSDEKLGKLIVNKCIKYGHWGIVESPSISFICEGFPHDAMVQARTHRVGITFNVQSQRYTGERIARLSDHLRRNNSDSEEAFSKIEDLFYLRPVGDYKDRNGNNYKYTRSMRLGDLGLIWQAIDRYSAQILDYGYAPEHARQMLPQNIRQTFTVTFNARSLMHFLDLRSTKDAQLEIRELSTMLFYLFSQWMPELAEFYKEKRLGKNRLSP